MSNVIQRFDLSHVKKEGGVAPFPAMGNFILTLLELKRKFNGKGDKIIIPSRCELTRYIGSVHETTTRLLSEFKTDKLVEINADGIKVINRDKLISASSLYT